MSSLEAKAVGFKQAPFGWPGLISGENVQKEQRELGESIHVFQHGVWCDIVLSQHRMARSKKNKSTGCTVTDLDLTPDSAC